MSPAASPARTPSPGQWSGVVGVLAQPPCLGGPHCGPWTAERLLPAGPGSLGAVCSGRWHPRGQQRELEDRVWAGMGGLQASRACSESLGWATQPASCGGHPLPSVKLPPACEPSPLPRGATPLALTHLPALLQMPPELVLSSLAGLSGAQPSCFVWGDQAASLWL